jgi:phosphopantothenoylcysteine decarboxylase/phosphopantothenate--cysteine ligase
VRIVLGITGSIAAYKALDLTRLLVKNGHEVKIIMTSAALNFVTPLSGQTLSKNEIYIDQFALTRGIKHLALAEWGDLLVVAPATANAIGKAAAGIGDDLLSTIMFSFPKPILFVPAMDEGMWGNPRVRENVQTLLADGRHFLSPISGPLASGKIGKGRFPPADMIFRKIRAVYESRSSLFGYKFLITGGRTETDLDPVRVFTNRSSGRMALELLAAALCRGADARGVFGEVGVALSEGMPLDRVRTNKEMLDILKRDIGWADCLIMAAAVSDYEPSTAASVKGHSPRVKLALKKSADILKILSSRKGNRIFVGFSLENHNGLDRARKKMKDKGVDLIVFNSLRTLGGDISDAQVLENRGRVHKFEASDKWATANRILDICLYRLKGSDPEPRKRRIR